MFSSYSVAYHIKLPNLWVNAASALLLSMCEIKSRGRVIMQNITCENSTSLSTSEVFVLFHSGFRKRYLEQWTRVADVSMNVLG